MGFTSETLVVPNVPPGRDVLTYLTDKPRDKEQENAHAQARALGVAKLHGVPSCDIERSFYGVDGGAAKPLTAEEKRALQNSKSPFIPNRLEPEVPKSIESPFPYPAVKPRSHAYTGQQLRFQRNPDRTSSCMGSRRAPVLRPSRAEFSDFGAYVAAHSALLREFGVLRVQPPDNESLPLPVGLLDQMPFKTESQVFAAADATDTFAYTTLRQGFYHALGRFLDKTAAARRPPKWPVVEGRPLDLYRFFRIVEQRHGPSNILRRKEWVQVTRELGFSRGQSTSLSLRSVYTKFLEPFRQWLSSQVLLDEARVLPLDVDVEREGWQVLEHGISYYTGSARGSLSIVCTQPPQRLLPPFTLRQFRYKWTRVLTSLADSERAYAELLEGSEAERVASAPVLTRLTPSTADDSAFDIMRLPFSGTLAPYLTDSADDFVFPRLDVGAQFATTQTQPGASGGVSVSLLFDGSPRTCFADGGVWSDHFPGEFLIIGEDTSATTFCHGYSAALTTTVWPLTRFMQRYAEHLPRTLACERVVCAEHAVYTASRDVSNLDEFQRASLLLVLERLRTRDVLLMRRLRAVARAYGLTLVEKPNSETRVCKGIRRFLVCVSVNKQYMSLARFLRQPVRNAKVKVYTKFENLDAEAFYDSLIAQVRSAPTFDESVSLWLAEVNRLLLRRQLISETEIETLCANHPRNSTECTAVAMRLLAVRSRMRAFLASCPQARPSLSTVECQDAKGVIEGLHAQRRRELSELGVDITGVLIKYSTGALCATDLVSFFKKHQHVKRFASFWENISEVEAWVVQVHRALTVGAVPDRGTALVQLRAESLRIGIPAMSNPMHAIHAFFEAQKKTVLSSMMFLYSHRMADSESLLRLQSVIAASYVEDPSTRARLKEIFDTLPVLLRLNDAVLVRRPRRSEVAHLVRYPLIESAFTDLDNWLARAKSLDWEAISMQVNAMAWGQPLPVLAKRVYVAAIRDAYRLLYTLRVVPDDVDSVETMFKNTLLGIDAVSAEMCSHYGFLK